MEHFLEAMEAFGAHANRFAESFSTNGANHELLERDGRVRVGTTIDDIHHRHGEHLGVWTTDVFVKRKA